MTKGPDNSAAAGKPESRVIEYRQGQFKKGQLGNPGGRPKGVLEVVKLARDDAPDAMKTLMALHKDPNQPGSVRAAAANAVLDRAYGKPKETKEVDINVRATKTRRMALDSLSDDQLFALEAALRETVLKLEAEEAQIIEGEASEVEGLMSP